MRLNGNAQVLHFFSQLKDPASAEHSDKDFAFKWYLFLSEAFGSMHTYIHYFSHTHSMTLFAIRIPSVSISYFVLFLLASTFEINTQCWSWCCWHGFMWRGFCWDICKSPAHSPTSASPAKERCSHAQHCSMCSVCFPCLLSFYLSIYLYIYLSFHPSIYLPFLHLSVFTHFSTFIFIHSFAL